MQGNTRRIRLKVRVIPFFLLIVIMIVLSYKVLTGGRHLAEPNDSEKISSVQTLNPAKEHSVLLSSKTLHSPYVILLDIDNNTILMEKNSKDKIYPASLTKMMTAITSIENLQDFKKEIKLTHYTFNGLYAADASLAGFQPGEGVRALDLLYGVMLPSGAEACIGLADEIAGSEKDFVQIMNQKAIDLGMNNTHFENATGLHNENHYTTVKDLAILLRYALQNDTFREIFTSSSHSTQPTNTHRGITFYNTMFEKLSNKSIAGGEIIGGKTGYTREAGLCLASLAIVGNKEYILITAGAKGDHFSEQYNITDALTVYNSIENK
ncbi:MAG: D-alanyl-D-alanine carboxypeptidase family protein [Acetivibrionales bacterium]|jgi:D-alanyl-D-alanine carboxypeptidase (penicillin-binding protein 5/6)